MHDRLDLAGWQAGSASPFTFRVSAISTCKTDRIDAWVLAKRSRRELVLGDLAARPTLAR